MNEPKSDSLLSIDNLQVSISTKRHPLHPVRGVSFCVDRGQRICLVGESGCGKTMTALSILRLLPKDKFTVNGSISYKGQDILTLSDEEMRQIRGREIAMISQEPMTALNPVLTIGFQIVEAITTHKIVPDNKAKEHALSMMAKVGIPEPELIYSQYPHQLSGGLRQRVMIAMALSCNPSLLIADEPTTALDVTIQAQILELICQLGATMDLSLILISHNLGVVAKVAQRVLVMYAGKVVEDSPVRELFLRPLHPYTKGLMASVPYGENINRKRLSSIPGQVPPLDKIPDGCSFRDRCSYAKEICAQKEPGLRELEGKRWVACHLAGEIV